MKEIVLVFILAFILAVHASPLRKCELINKDVLCQCHYNSTYFPNDRFSSQAGAERQFNQFQDLVRTNCSAYLVTFLCSRYFPPCSPHWNNVNYVLPCRELCEKVKSDCEPVLQQYVSNAKWPNELSCDAFQSINNTKSSGIPCISLESVATTSRTDDEVCENKEKCVNIEHDKGKSASYKTFFPNAVTISQTNASQGLDNVLKNKCLQEAEQFFILRHYPPCTESNDTVNLLYPCKRLCRQIKKECEQKLGNKLVWPDYMDCRSLSKDGCIDDLSSYFVKPSPKEPSNQQPITTPTAKPMKSCKEFIETSCGELNEFSGLPKIEFPEYNSTFAQYVNLLNNSCSVWLKPFLCYEAFSAYKKTDSTERVKPCRNVCRKAETECLTCFTKLGLSWSDYWDCKDFQVKKDCIGLNELKSYESNANVGSSSCPETKDNELCTP